MKVTPHDTTPTKGERTRSLLLEAAYGQFVRKGYHGASMRSIADAAGITVGAIYNHFKSKEDIFEAVILAYHPFASLLPELAQMQGETLEAMLSDAVERFLAAVEEHPGIINLMLIEMVECEGRHLPDLMGAFVPDAARFAARIRQAPDISPTIPPFVLVRTFLSMLFAYYITQQMFIEADLPVDIGDYQHFLDIYLHGATAREETTP